MSASHSHEKHIRAIRSWRSKNALFLVSTKTEGDKRAVPERCILRALLAAKITPRQTVEVVCKKKIEAGTFSGYKYRDLLLGAGLRLTLDDEGPKLHLLSAYAFKVAFPGLEHAVPMLEACKGISIRIADEPVAPTCPDVEKSRRQRSASKAEAPAISAPPLSQMAKSALRKLVMSRPLAGTTVRELLKRANGCKDDAVRRVTAFTTTSVALVRYGIMLHYDESDSTADFYAEVVDAKLLARRVPELKNVAPSLGGLFLY